MRVYVAGSSAEVDRARWVGETLAATGCVVTSTWWDQVEKFGQGNPEDDEVRRRCARLDIFELDSADAFLLLVPKEGYSHGAFFELGRAVALGKKVICAGATKRSIFCVLGTECATDGDAVALFGMLAQEAA